MCLGAEFALARLDTPAAVKVAEASGATLTGWYHGETARANVDWGANIKAPRRFGRRGSPKGAEANKKSTSPKPNLARFNSGLELWSAEVYYTRFLSLLEAGTGTTDDIAGCPFGTKRRCPR